MFTYIKQTVLDTLGSKADNGDFLVGTPNFMLLL